MKNTLKYVLIGLIFGSTMMVSAQTTNPPVTVKGDINIKYNTRNATPVSKGIVDVYTINLNVANSALFRGTITDTPQLIDGWINKTVIQGRSLNYDISCDVINPKNISQTKNVGRMLGRVPISSDGTYRYDLGTLEISVLPMGNAGGFTSKFGGTALGKPLNRPPNWMDTLRRETVNITRSVNGKTMTVSLKKYDKMEFRQHVIAAGPVPIYQSVTANGEMFYDYDKNCWFFNNVTVQYADNGIIKLDRLSGTIRWVESANRKANGEGEYQFDIRVNEPPPNTAVVFAAPSDESAFFETDSSVPSLTGTMKYKDTLRGDTTLASQVAIDLVGNNITKQQTMVLGKLIIFSSVVPMNSD